MRLTDPWFEARFYGQITADGSHRDLPSIDGAQGLIMYCPCGYGKPSAGAHHFMVPFANPRNAPPCPAKHGPLDTSNPDGPRPRWMVQGAGLEDLSVQPSVNVGKPSCFHGHITRGEIT